MSRKGGVFMRVHLPGNGGMTMVENTFIDRFMPAASGDFVKIYLYLLRCVQEGNKDVTISQIADALNYTEADVKRALGYWKRMQMLDFDDDSDSGDNGSAGSVMVSSDAADSVPAGMAPAGSAPASSSSAPSGSKIMEFRPAQPQKSPSRDEISSVFFVAETYLGRLLTTTEQRTLLYFMTDLGMNADLIDFLLEYCVSKNHTSFHYIQKVAQNWYQDGIRTVEQARREGSLFKNEYFEIFRSLGIQGRVPTPAETEYMDRWLGEYAFTTDLICRACERTILQTGKAQFSYTDSILRSWHENNVRSLTDVERLDQLHAQTASQIQSRQSAARTASAGRFVNFEPSGNNWDDLAMQVMQAQDADPMRKSQES